MAETARVSISGVRSPLAMRVAQRRDRGVTLEQSLPFLAIGTDVTSETGELGRIERVAVVLERGVPKIVLEVAYDRAPDRASMTSRPARGDPTISYDQRPSQAPAGRIDLDSAQVAKVGHGERALAFPLETRRPSPALRPSGWLARLFAPLLGLFSARFF